MAKVDTNRNLVAALSYLPFFAIFLSVVILFVEKDDKFIRFHALQSLFISVGYYTANILISIIFSKGLLAFLSSVLSPLLVLAVTIVWVVSMMKAYRGKIVKWPVVGKLAESIVK